MIVSVTGHADSFDLVFNLCSDGRWAVTVPPDLSDGKYVCDVYAVNHMGETAYWTGILYMAHGACVCFELIEDVVNAWLMPERTEIVLLKKRCC